ncbi:MAG: signal peptidase I [Thermoprotei archaeon]|nr:MAG: signal peptidase I [Thermoprotei archaeon]
MPKEKEKNYQEIIIFVAFLAIITVFFLLLGKILNTEVPLAVVSSWSMEPTLHVGDIVVVTGSSIYNIGDVIVYDNGRTLIVHRIIEKNGPRFTTKGDANNFPDSYRPTLKDIKGKVVLVIPYLGAIKLFVERILWH